MNRQDDEFGHRVRQALDEGLDQLDYRAVHRLEQARNAALARHAAVQSAPGWVAVPQSAGGPAVGDEGGNLWWRRLGVALPLLLLAAASFAVYEWQHARSIADQANMDFAVLMDETPIDAYADKGFGVFLQTGDTPPAEPQQR
jgi:hypothetical protein